MKKVLENILAQPFSGVNKGSLQTKGITKEVKHIYTQYSRSAHNDYDDNSVNFTIQLKQYSNIIKIKLKLECHK